MGTFGSFDQSNRTLPAARTFGRKLLLAVIAHCFGNAPSRGFGSISFADLFGSVRNARRCTVERGKGARVLDGV